MEILPFILEDYLHQIIPERNAILQEMEDQAAQIHFPIVGPLVGRILYQYARLLNPQKILELGSGYGYSALWWAMATSTSCKIFCTEDSEENIRRGKEWLKRAGYEKKVEYFYGNALETMNEIEGEFDIIFMDIDKHQYPEGFRKGWPRLRVGGLFIADNALWYGRIVEGDHSPDTEGVKEFNRLIYSTAGAFSTILPIRDGVAVTLRESV